MRRILLLPALLAVATQAIANETIDASLMQTTLEYTKMHSAYREYNEGQAYNANAGKYLNTENGNVGQYGLRSSMFIGPMVLGSSVRYAKGDTRYDGYRQDGMGGLTPAKATTGNKFIDLSTNLGMRMNVRQDIAIVPYGELGVRLWERTLGKGEADSFVETYQHAHVGAGLRTLWSPMKHLTVEAQGMLGKTVRSQMSLDGTNFDLGSKPVYQAGLGVDYAIRDSVHVNMGYQYEQFAYGESDWVQIDSTSSAMEPASKTERNRFTVGIGMGF